MKNGEIRRGPFSASVMGAHPDSTWGTAVGFLNFALVGLSMHSVTQVDAAMREPASYIAVGPIFGTTTKDTGYRPVGLELVREAARRAGGRPVVAIGGITLETARAVVDAGAQSVAVIGDLFTGGDPAARVRAYLRLLDRRDTRV